MCTLERNKEVDLDCLKCHMLKIENEKLKEEALKLTKFEKSTHYLNEILNNQKPSSEKLGLEFNSFEASSSVTKEIKFVKAQKKVSLNGGPIIMGAPLNVQAAPKANMRPPPGTTPGSEKSVSFQKSILGPRPKHIIVNNVRVPVASDNEVKQFYKPLSKLGICLGVDLEPDEWIKDSGCSKHMTGTESSSQATRYTTEGLESGRYSVSKVLDTAYRRHIYAISSLMDTAYWLSEQKPTLDYFRVFGSKCFILNTKDYLTKFDPKSYEGVFLGYSQNSKAYIIVNKHTRKVKESLNMTFKETPPASKTSPLVDDDLDEEEAIKVTKKNLENDFEDKTLEIDKIVNIKESRNHPLENVIGNLHQSTLRSQAQNQSNFFCFISTIEPKNVNEALKDDS
ncbi:retrovirus-related pol polyprotein from transposon TNT 1-94 [Tanacetum coccineum]|uniref:Retrovirus-related pol polyprotein from transposon TNT 1-94 n=1 Tax=Tanacetum coccineum TaxID=301880 RepID=A0ABQ5EA70_9ASTR